MNNQEAFDKALQGLRKQGVASMGEDAEDGVICMYRGEGGNKCAAGHLIPDELYSPHMENQRITVIWDETPEMEALFKDVNEDLLYDLQSCHDNALKGSGLPAWERRMQEIAHVYKLNYTAP